jgi:type VII secretion-associated serine protease mycosin
VVAAALVGAIVVPAAGAAAPAAPVAAAAVRPSAHAHGLSPGLRGRIPDIDPNHLMVRLRSHPADLAARMASAGARFDRAIPHTSWAEVSIRPGTSGRVRALLGHDSAVAQTQISYRRHALSIPNDPMWATAQSSYLSPIRVDRAWDVTQGSGIVVAVVDTGVDLNHPDLAGRLVHGTDIVNAGSNPQDDVGHGTMVAGIIVADRNNGRGIAGVAPLAKVMPVKVLGKNGVGNDGDIATGITWATDHGASVINLSLGGPLDDPALRAAVAYAISHNVVVVAAAGNDGAETVEYPAAYPGVIAVSATGHTGALTSFSSWGSRIDIAAPGLDITSTALGTTYDVESGTSFSSPIVAGVAALVRARFPAFTAADVRARLLSTARDVGLPGVDRAFGHGLVDALAAVDSSHPAAPHPTFRVGPNEPNDTISEATPISIGTTVASRIAPETDEDWYKVTFAGTGWYKIAVPSGNGAFASSMDPIVELYDSTHAFQASQDLLGGPLVVPIESAGDRYIRVRNRGGDAASYTIKVTATTAPPAFGAPLELDLGSEAQSLGVGDFNNDGRPDLAFLMGDSSTIFDTLVTLLQTPLRSFVVGDVIATDPTSGNGMAVGKINSDSFDDIAIPTIGGVDVYLGSGAGLDSTPIFHATAFTPSEVAIAHVDADPNADLVVGGSGGIVVYYGPAFGTSTTVTATAIPHSFAVGDVTGDGRADVVAAIGNKVHTFVQAAGPSFVDSTQDLTNARSVALGDLNSDGYLDAAVSIRAPAPSGKVAELFQSGGALGAPASYSTEAYADSIAIADVNQDGKNDVVVLHDQTGDVGILFHGGGASLNPEQPLAFDDFGASYDPNALAVTDLDSDGYPDIAVATSFGLSLLMQQPAHLPALGKTWVNTASPADLEVNVASGVVPVLTLDRAATNVDGTTVKLYDESGNEVAATPVWAGGPQTITITPNAPLADGSYEVRVEGLQDGSGDTLDQFSTRFTVGAPPDETPPNTVLHAPPSGFTTSPLATLSFSASDATGFECSLDNARYTACTSPVHVTVAQGAHTFRVFAHDAAHNEDPSPAVAGWTYRPPPHGYWMLGRSGHVYRFGSVPNYGGPTTTTATDIESTPSGFGYWTVDAFGHVRAFGDAGFHGDASGKLVGEFVTGISRTATGRGYWLFTTRGRVFAFGDARFYGDLSAKHLNGPILDSVGTPSGHGYYMVGSDGGVFTLGDAAYHGSTGGLHIPAPIRTLVPDPDHVGYWLVGVDGSIYPFAAPFRGSMRGRPLNKPIVGMVAFGNGYLMVAADGGIFNFSNKPYCGSLGGNPPAVPIVSVAAFA